MASPSEHNDTPSAADLWGDWTPSEPPVDGDWVCEFCAAENTSCYSFACSFCHIRRDA